jgi:hypothetical protein
MIKMVKNLFVLMAVALLLTACGGQSGKKAETPEDIISIALADFDAKAPEMIEKTVLVSGTVAHVCKHGGKRLFLVDETTDARIKVEIEEDDQAAFPVELEGAVLEVTGIVKELRVDEAYLAEWEAEVNAQIAEGQEEHADHEKGMHLGEEGHENATGAEDLVKIENLRKEIAESGTDHLSYFSIKYVSNKVLEEAVADQRVADPETESEGEEEVQD